MIIANQEIYAQTPRAIQIICLLFYLEGYKKSHNLILEVLTGEGKTLAISFLALYLSIIGSKVDILTSSPALAERDAKEREKFYNRFGISCDFCRFDSKNNIDHFIQFESEKSQFECYKADIVYGGGTNDKGSKNGSMDPDPRTGSKLEPWILRTQTIFKFDSIMFRSGRLDWIRTRGQDQGRNKNMINEININKLNKKIID